MRQISIHVEWPLWVYFLGSASLGLLPSFPLLALVSGSRDLPFLVCRACVAQFEQPLEETGSLNLWSRDAEGSPSVELRDLRMRDIHLFDHLERELTSVYGNAAGTVLGALAAQLQQPKDTEAGAADAVLSAESLARANSTLHAAALQWRKWVSGLPGGHPDTQRAESELIAGYLEQSHAHALREARWHGWQPGVEWDMSKVAQLPKALRARCGPAPRSTPFASVCS